MDSFIQDMPFFTSEQRQLAFRVEEFVEREIETEVNEDNDEETQFRSILSLLAEAGLFRYAVIKPEQRVDLRSLCLIRESLSYSSAMADLAFVMQGLGTYAVSLAAPDHVRDFWLNRALTGNAIAEFALT
jgi:acyl-CoA dehydrogenase